MTDLEMTKACAVKIGYKSIKLGTGRGPGHEPHTAVWVADDPDADHCIYEVLGGLFAGAEAMGLVRRFPEQCLIAMAHAVSASRIEHSMRGKSDCTADLNRAIAQCVAQMP